MTAHLHLEPPPLIGRDDLVAAITTFLAGQEPHTLAAIRESVERTIDEAGPEALAQLGARLAQTGADWRYYPSDPLARRIHHVIADRMLDRDSTLAGLEHVEAVSDQPVIVLANHLSYSDANLLEVMLRRAGGDSMADRLTAIAGPKVYSSLKRRFSSLCFGTIKTPQSSARSTEDAVMNARDVARAARQSIDHAHDRLNQGDALLVFAEGSRSRTGGMQQTLAAASRYLDAPAAGVLLPVGITGTEAMFPIGDDRLHPVRTDVRIGPPVSAAALRARAGGNRRLMMDGIGIAIAELLPPSYRGVYAGHSQEIDEARRLMSGLVA